MKSCKSLFLGCALALLVLPLAGAVDNASAQNLLMNGTFETGDLTAWTTFGESGLSSLAIQSPENGPSLPGTNSVFMDNQAQALALGLKQSSAVGSAAAGPVYYAFDLKLGESLNGGVFFVEIFAEQAGGGVIGGTGVLGPFFPAEWTTIEGTFVAPVNTDFVTFQFAAITGAVEGTVSTMSVDNAYLSQEGPPVPNETVNWGDAKALYR
jgi:hypothetical protein